MAEVKADIAGKQITIKIRRELLRINIHNVREKITVHYREIQYTGTIGTGTYNEISTIDKSYEADYAAWFADAVGKTIKAAVEVQLALDEPGTPNE